MSSVFKTVVVALRVARWVRLPCTLAVVGRHVERRALTRLGTSDDVASLVAFPASDDA